jgi:hypothetical protein
VTSLRDFIAARLEEEEASARDMPSGNIVEYLALDLKCHSGNREPGGTPEGLNILWASIHVGDYGPRWPLLNDFRDRVRREVAAKRRVMERHRPHDTLPDHCRGCGDDDMGPLSGLEECSELLDLAAPYSDHEDFREAWAA